MKKSAGILLYNQQSPEITYFLVHPGGPFFARKDEGWWTIPKGEFTAPEEPLAAAIREFEEETGYRPAGNFIPLQQIVQKGGKQVQCWAVEGYLDPQTITSNTFEIEWPPGSGKQRGFPEVDRAGWFNYAAAARYFIWKFGYLDI